MTAEDQMITPKPIDDMILPDLELFFERNPGAWIQGSEAQGEDGSELLALDPKAVKWSVDGMLAKLAIEAEEKGLGTNLLEKAMKRIEDEFERFYPDFKTTDYGTRKFIAWHDRKSTKVEDILNFLNILNGVHIEI